MCGIAGFFGDFSESLLAEMTRIISHRGPDDSGTWIDLENGVGLGHRRLSIIDLSPLGHQPMWDATGKTAIVYNGEIYNYRELRTELEKDGFKFNGHSDTEVLLNLFLRDGPRMLDRLNGIFAFALWDARDKSLFLARDGVGVKPLYYARTGKGVLFASEMKSLLLEPGLDRSLNPRAIYSYLTYLWSPAPDTMLKSVRKLEPGHAMIVKEGRVERIWQYYELPYDQKITELSVPDAIRQVRDKLRTAVRRQMVADVDVGAFLSGGLDSSAVAAMAREFSPDRKLQCFTIGFRDDRMAREGFADDLPYAKRVAQHLGVALETIYVGPEMADELEKMIYHLDEPQGDPAPLNVLFICRLAREHGLKVLLSGTGGDDIFTGYRRHRALLLERYWAWLPRGLRRGIKRSLDRLPEKKAWARRMAKALRYADREGDERIAGYFHWLEDSLILDCCSPSLRESLAGQAFSRPLTAALSGLPATIEPLNRMLYLEAKHFLCDHNLNYTDKMSMAVGVETRVPLLDPDLVALAARLPIDYKQKGGTGKWIFKKAMEPYLPRDVIYRPKTGFGAPLRGWLGRELRPTVEDALSRTSIESRGLFDYQGVRRLLDLDRAGRVDGSYTIFSLVCIELWCRIFLDRPLPTNQ